MWECYARLSRKRTFICAIIIPSVNRINHLTFSFPEKSARDQFVLRRQIYCPSKIPGWKIVKNTISFRLHGQARFFLSANQFYNWISRRNRILVNRINLDSIETRQKPIGIDSVCVCQTPECDRAIRPRDYVRFRFVAQIILNFNDKTVAVWYRNIIYFQATRCFSRIPSLRYSFRNEILMTILNGNRQIFYYQWGIRDMLAKWAIKTFGILHLENKQSECTRSLRRQ